MNPQAEALNADIRKNNPAIYKMLSQKGRNIFFPGKGILGQTADARNKSINATIGAAIEEDGSPVRMNLLENMTTLPPDQVFPYAPSFGRPDLRDKWKKLIYQKNPGLEEQPISLPIVTSALTHALSIIGYLFIDQEDDVWVSDLYWGNYNLIFNNGLGANLEKFNLFENNHFGLASFRSSMMQKEKKKKIVLLNFPNNPTGYTPTVEEMLEIINILHASAEAGNELIVIADDAYFGLVYENGVELQSPFAYLANLHENILAIKVDGPTKEDYAWGFRIGFITYACKGGSKSLYQALESKTAGAIRGNISNACNLTQSMLLKAYNHADYNQQKQNKYELLKARYQAVKNALQKEKYQSYFYPYPYNSGYFMCIGLKENIDGEELRQLLLKKYDTGVINMNNIIRIAFSAVAENKIPLLFENIYLACQELKKN